ncbi:MAG TPA: hypothetical protein EYG49_00665 [Gammaproteobacteria bacterium]|nr:hypothetical protein [Gammaproteobacteria bacterium]
MENDIINTDQNILKGEMLLDAVAQKKGTKGLVKALETAMEQGDLKASQVLLLAGLETPEVAKYVAARIPQFVKLPGTNTEIRSNILKRFPLDLANGLSIEIVEAVLENVAGKADYQQLLLLAHKHTGHFRFGWQLSKDLTMGGNLDQAVIVLDEMEERGHQHTFIYQSHAEYLSVLGQHKRAIEISHKISNENPTETNLKRSYLRMLMAGGSLAELERELPIILAANPSDWMLAAFLHRARVSAATLIKCFALLVPPNTSSDPRYILYYAASAIAVNDLDAVRAALTLNIPDEIAYAQSFKRGVQYVLDRDIKISSRFVCDPTQSYQVVKAGKGKPTVVVCLSNSGINFSFLSIGFIDQLLSEFDVNVIYLHESRKMLFHGGIEGLGDTEAETLAAIERLHDELDSSLKVTMGASLGGYGAARYGHLSKANAVLSFSGPTDMFQFTEAAIPQAIHTPQFLIMQQVRRTLTAQDCKLKSVIETSGTKHYQFYGEQASIDTIQANNIANLSNVELIPVPEITDHFVFGYCVANGQLQKILSEVLTN